MKRIPEEKIRKIHELKEMGSTKYAIAKELGISTGAVSYHLKGKKSPFDEMEELAILRKRNHLLVDLIATYQ
jgi:predicted transcriptional regulator